MPPSTNEVFRLLRVLLCFAPLAVALIACCAGDHPDESPDVITRVEDGVTIVENAGLHVADTLAWSIDTATAVTIGVLEGPDEYVFGRIGGLLLRRDSTILVADALANEVRAFDLNGDFIRRFGRRGDGPGEFRGISALAELDGDSVAVMSNGSQRVDLFGPELDFVRRYQPRLAEMNAAPPLTSDILVGLFADARPLMGDYLRVCESGLGRVCADSIDLVRTDETGNILARFGRFVYNRRESYQIRPGRSTSWLEPHPQVFWTVSGERVYYADSKTFEILVFTTDGALERRIHVAGDAQNYSKDEIWPELPEAPPDDPDMVEAVRVLRDARAGAELPDTFPSFSDLLVDAAGNIWVREYRSRAGAVRWYVFDPEGRLRWSVRSAPGMARSPSPVGRLAPFIGDDHIVASVRDANDVETVVVYRLIKDGAG